MAKARKEGCEAKAKPREERVEFLFMVADVKWSRLSPMALEEIVLLSSYGAFKSCS